MKGVESLNRIQSLKGFWKSRKIPGFNFWESQDRDFEEIPGSRRGLVVGSLRAPSVLLETKYDVVKINSNKVPLAHIFCYWKVSNITHRSIFNTDTNPTTVTFRLIFDLFELTHNFARTGHRWRALSTAFWSASPPLTLSLSSPPSSCSVCQGHGQYSFSKNWCHWHIFFLSIYTHSLVIGWEPNINTL